jgi:uncharacterized protein YkwD
VGVNRLVWLILLVVAEVLVAPSTAAGATPAAYPPTTSPTSEPSRTTDANGPQPAPDVERDFAQMINNLRTSKGLRPLDPDTSLTAIARRWALAMGDAGHISHNSALESQVTENWLKLGENVGSGPSAQALFQAFVASPEHYQNLVDPDFARIGVGAVRTADGRIYTTHDFLQLEPAVVPPTPHPRPTPPAPSIAALPRLAPVTAPPPPPVLTAPNPPPMRQAPRQPGRKTSAAGTGAHVDALLLLVAAVLLADHLVLAYRDRLHAGEWLVDRIAPYVATTPPAGASSRRLPSTTAPDAPPATIELTSRASVDLRTTTAAVEGDDLARQLPR